TVRRGHRQGEGEDGEGQGGGEGYHRPQRTGPPVITPLPRPAARRVSRSGRTGAGGGEPAGPPRCATAHPAGHRAAVGYRGVVSRGPQLPDPVRCRGPADHHGRIPAGREGPAGPT